MPHPFQCSACVNRGPPHAAVWGALISCIHVWCMLGRQATTPVRSLHPLKKGNLWQGCLNAHSVPGHMGRVYYVYCRGVGTPCCANAPHRMTGCNTFPAVTPSQVFFKRRWSLSSQEDDSGRVAACRSTWNVGRCAPRHANVACALLFV